MSEKLVRPARLAPDQPLLARESSASWQGDGFSGLTPEFIGNRRMPQQFKVDDVVEFHNPQLAGQGTMGIVTGYVPIGTINVLIPEWESRRGPDDPPNPYWNTPIEYARLVWRPDDDTKCACGRQLSPGAIAEGKKTCPTCDANEIGMVRSPRGTGPIPWLGPVMKVVDKVAPPEKQIMSPRWLLRKALPPPAVSAIENTLLYGSPVVRESFPEIPKPARLRKVPEERWKAISHDPETYGYKPGAKRDFWCVSWSRAWKSSTTLSYEESELEMESGFDTLEAAICWCIDRARNDPRFVGASIYPRPEEVVDESFSESGYRVRHWRWQSDDSTETWRKGAGKYDACVNYDRAELLKL